MMQDNEKQIIGLKIKNLRKTRNMTLERFAKEFSEFIYRIPPYSKSTINQWECGRKMPTEDVLTDICRYYGLDENYLKIDGTNDGIRIKEAGDMLLIKVTSLQDIRNLYPIRARDSDQNNDKVYIKFIRKEHSDDWYAIDYNNKIIVNKDKHKTIPFSELRFVEFYISNVMPIPDNKLNKYSKVYIQMKSIDKKAEQIYSGWYRYNKDNKTFINIQNDITISYYWLYETCLPYPCKV